MRTEDIDVPRRADGLARRSCVGGVAALIAVLTVVVVLSDGLPASVRVVAGSARAADRLGESDQDQITDTLHAITDSYNRRDIKSAQLLLCAPARSQWDGALERAWMRYRQDHGDLRFTVESIDVDGTTADVVGTQQYTNDAVPKRFTAKFGRSPHGWKMCSST